jgi:HEPN domain-containing protein
MSKYQNSLYPEDWRTVARKDLDRVERNLNEGDIEAAGFFLQQALEKYLKAFLLEKGWELQKTHALYTLLDYAIEFDSGLENFRSLCERATSYYLTERYPQLATPELTRKDIEKDLEEARRFIKALSGENQPPRHEGSQGELNGVAF